MVAGRLDGRFTMHYENAYYFLPVEQVEKRLDLEKRAKGCRNFEDKWDVCTHPVAACRGRWRGVLVELHHYPIADHHAWLPEQHEFVGRRGTRVQAQAERYIDLLAFKLYLRSKIDKYRVPG